jgi:hypothetical protein
LITLLDVLYMMFYDVLHENPPAKLRLLNNE